MEITLEAKYFTMALLFGRNYSIFLNTCELLTKSDVGETFGVVSYTNATKSLGQKSRCRYIYTLDLICTTASGRLLLSRGRKVEKDSTVKTRKIEYLHNLHIFPWRTEWALAILEAGGKIDSLVNLGRELLLSDPSLVSLVARPGPGARYGGCGDTQISKFFTVRADGPPSDDVTKWRRTSSPRTSRTVFSNLPNYPTPR